MNPRPPRSRRPLSIIAAGITLALTTSVFADVIVLKNGQRREGEIVGVTGNNVSIRIGPAQSTVPLADIASVEMDIPAAFTAASRSMQDGNAARALVEIRPVIDQYRGLPLDWARQAFAIQADALVELNQLDEAQRVFEAFEAAYPGGDPLASVSSARLDIARGDFDSAREKLAPVVSEASAVLLAEPSRSAQLGRAFLLMGQVREEAGEYPAAIEDYLRTVTIFYADAAAVAEARTRADALIAQKNVIAP